MSVSCLIPVRNDALRLRHCLEAIARSAPAGIDLEIIVADNGSTDGSAAVARAAGAQVLSLPGLGVAELRNRAAAAAAADVLAFIDADHEIGDGWFAAASRALAGERVGAAGALYLAPDGGTWVQRMYGALRGRTTVAGDVPWLGSGNLAVRREAFDAIGGFDTSLVACEDVDFCQRLRQAGWRVVGDPKLRSVHHGDPRTLGALFRAERWRGRNNIRVSLRGPLSLRGAASVLIPVLDVLAALTVAIALTVAPFAGPAAWRIAAAALLMIGAFSMLRAVRLARRASGGVVTWIQAGAVAATYDAGRAAALLTAAPHHRDQSAGPTAAGARVA